MEPVELLFSCTWSAWVREKVSTITPDHNDPVVGGLGLRLRDTGKFNLAAPSPDVKVGGLTPTNRYGFAIGQPFKTH